MSRTTISGRARALPRKRRIPERLVSVVLLIGVAALGLACGRAPERGAGAAAAPTVLPQAALDAMDAALERYELARALLAQNRYDGLAETAAQLAGDLRSARASWPEGDEPLAPELDRAVAAAEKLGAARDIAGSRVAFGEVSRHVLALAAADPRLREGRHVFECPMTTTFPQWLQASEDVANPYMGAEMGSCGERAAWPEDAASAEGGTS
ncbi:MAG TPA: hypothetical protein VNB06_12995 [Thermoanaerobaculia bacterium]|nr:hypothetical protein [Thermoanaerobaculia bacterium]